ncbi:glutathione S-transferase-like protein [Stereum hirsutum FP-91666 SS1]|uniref:glutathione S-transferase-like protein n=1 Tax=Stereum hirsutum (strain FP-91666) TaxID=721885 RepID=UPI000440CB88|nr:glutathione S-transferase-like protein [Stereum hirsutum FP-91666 SS1]EIM86362.1 glutathione S-transferase-like protein [Stereum hirsutum FP-91666 SS1]
MVLKLYGMPVSTCTKRVATALKEFNVPYELVVVDLTKGAHKAPSFTEIQPFGQVPYIDDDGFILYESRAICRYIAVKYAAQGPQPPLLPPTTDLAKYAKFEQAVSIEMQNFDPSAAKLVFEKVFKPFFGGTPDDAVAAELLKTLDAKLDAYETILSKQKYLAGDDYTLADLYHLPYGYMLAAAGSDTMSRRPNVGRWWKDITSRPGWLAVQDGA